MEEPTDGTDPAAPMSELLRGLAARGKVRQFSKASLLIKEGEHGDALYIVLRGSVKAFSTDGRGREITYGTYGPGEYLGEMNLDGGPRSASVITLETTDCAVVKRDVLRAYIVAEPEFAFELLERMIRRVRVLTEHTRGLALLGVYPRLVKVLIGMAAPTADGAQAITPRPTHLDLASRVGSSREMVSRLMKDLERGHYIAIAGPTLTILRKLPRDW